MQQIQVSRGKLNVRRKSKNLLPGELFIDYARGKKYDKNSNSYELYTYADGEVVKLGGQGVLSFIRELTTGELPTNPVQGGIYYVTEDIQIGDSNNSSSGKNIPEFKKGDLAIYVGEDLNYANPDGDTSKVNLRGAGTFTAAPGWIRVNNGGGTAYEVTFDNTYTNYHAENVQEALVEADRNKLAFGGVLFKKEAAAGDSTTHGTATIDTQSIAQDKNYFEITKSALFPSIRVGYYYSVGELVPNTNIHIVDGDETLVLEEGDFLVVTSSVTTNDKALTADDVKLTKMAGGTHDAARINYQAGKRNETYENSSDKAWEDADAAVKNIKEALDNLYQSKADLTAKGKIPLTQLPDTLLNSMEYQGTYIVSGDTAFTLPTAKDKAHTDETTEDVELVQGDYFIYSGKQVDISKVEGLSDLVESSEGFINSGDWLVYNGKGNKWSVVDNTSPIQAIKVLDNYSDNGDDVINQTTMAGEVKFQGAKRAVDRNGENISETQLEADDKETVTVHNVNAALISDGNKAEVNGFYKENGAKTLVKTGVSETDEGQLIFNEKEGIELTGGVKATKAVISKDADGKSWGDAVAEGDSLKADIIQNPAQSEYGNIQLKLPSQSGTLARLEDTGLTDGQNFYIPRFKKDENDNNNIKLVNSPVELIDHLDSGESSTIVGFKFHKASGNTGLQADNKVIFRGSGEVVNIMPKTSGYVLNSNSIIDCGEWTDTGIVFENEGNFDSYHNATMTTESDLYREAIIKHEYLDSGEVAALITD